MDLGTRLAIVRRARHLKQKDVAAAVGITQKHLSQLELGGASLLKLQSGVLLALANTLQVSTDYLLGRTAESSDLAAVPQPEVPAPPRSHRRAPRPGTV
jgi:transcriptional regulator with XRE-family HTH domain